MASARQTAANRQNARKSRGPRSSAGKRRSSSNSLRHGLSRRVGESTQIDELAQLIVGDLADDEALDLACDVVRAHLDLLRVREVKRDLMERMYALGTVNPLRRFRSMGQPLDQPLRLPQRRNPLGPMPVDEDERVAEAMRRLLPELCKLDRYERRAFKAKQRALRALANCRQALRRSDARTGAVPFGNDLAAPPKR
jgi:hypothetical protein